LSLVQARYILRVLLVGLSLLLIAVAYSNTFTSPPVLDDFHSFVRNPHVHVDKLSYDNIYRLADGEFGVRRFLPTLTFALDYYLGGGQIWVFHLTNLIIHMLCFAAVIWLVWGLTEASGASFGVSPDGRFYFSAFVATLWALNPVQTSAVTYIVQRMASLQAMFFVSSAASYVSARLAGLHGRRGAALLLGGVCLILAICAFLSKENSAMLPVVFIVLDLWFFQAEFTRFLIRKVQRCNRRPVVIALIGCICLLSTVLLGHVLKDIVAGYSNRHFTLVQRLLTESRIVLQYLLTILFPNPAFLSIEHDVSISTSLFSPPQTILSIVIIVVLVFLSFLYCKQLPLITFGIIWFFVNLLIESTIVPLELKFDHRMYLPSIGVTLAVCHAMLIFRKKVLSSYCMADQMKILWAVFSILCSILCVTSYARNQDWRDILTINKDAVEKAPNNPRAHANYSVALGRAGHYKESIEEARKAIELGRKGLEEYFVASTSIVSSYLNQGNVYEAIKMGEELLEKQPSSFDATSLPLFYLKLADCYRIEKNYAMAYGYVEKTLDLVQKYVKLNANKKWAYLELGSILRDIESLQEDIDGDGLPDPGPLSPDEWIAQKLYDLEDYDGALLFAQRVPESPVAQSVLRRIALFKDRTGEQERRWSFAEKYLERPWSISNITLGVSYAIRRYEVVRALRPFGERLLNGLLGREPLNPDAYLLSGWYAFEDGDYEGAVASAKKAIELDPQYAKAWIALGFFAQKKGDVATSLTAFRQTLELYPGYPKRDVLEELMARLEASAVATPEAGKEPVQGAA